MKRYTVEIKVTVLEQVDVGAESEDHAAEIACDEAMQANPEAVSAEVIGIEEIEDDD